VNGFSFNNTSSETRFFKKKPGFFLIDIKHLTEVTLGRDYKSKEEN